MKSQFKENASFDDVLEAEQAITQKDKDLIGLAFSGGGIRSATLNLGVLQGLAGKGLLDKFDYLSTVSGGGYIGAWFSSLIKRHHAGLVGVQTELANSTKPKSAGVEPSITDGAIAWLRSYSNYLTPKTGLFSLDTLSAFAQWFANTFLNQLLLLASLVAIMMIVIFLSHSAITSTSGTSITFDFMYLKEHHSGIQSTGLLILFLSLILALLVFRGKCAALISQIRATLLICNINLEIFIFGLGLFGIIIYLFGLPIEMPQHLANFTSVSSKLAPISPNYNIGLGVPIITLLISFLIITIRPLFKIDAVKSEWWYRMGGINISISLIWLTLFCCALYIPYLINNKLDVWEISLTSAIAWLFSFSTAKLGQSKFSSESNALISLATLSKILPYIVVAIIFLGAGYLSYTIYQSPYRYAWFAVMLVIMLYGSFKFGINIFSLHNFYRNRLTRCYLGASNPMRKETLDIFSGFANDDDMWLAELKDQKPILIINTALNISDSSELSMQQRKAAAFFFTPYSSGFEFNASNGEKKSGFIETAQYTYPKLGENFRSGPFLGSLMAVSGAAASPNMGYHTSSVMGFIMTIFNARLGRWFGNPNNPIAASKSSPTGNLAYLAKELFTNTNADSDFLYLSDGGHFENLGIYELVRRKCKLIIAVDAGQDDSYTFEDLGNAMRKCQVDLNVTIDINVSDIHPTIQSKYGDFKHAKKHYAVGEIIYDQANPQNNGLLVYIKNSLTGDEPTDLINFKLQEPAFPNHSTVDQFFDESQFESYRCLGQYIGNTIIESLMKPTGLYERKAKTLLGI